MLRTKKYLVHSNVDSIIPYPGGVVKAIFAPGLARQVASIDRAVWPCHNDALSDESQSTISATSSGLPSRPMECIEMSMLFKPHQLPARR
jgi:hypothetical protein